jgi:hypothetical protein
MKSIFEENGGTYSQVGDYLLPDVILQTAKEEFSIGKYGRMHKAFLKENRKVFYARLVITCKLFDYLSEIDAHASEMFVNLIREMAKNENITEEFKAENQMAWVGAMNNIRHRAEEIVFHELIYV